MTLKRKLIIKKVNIIQIICLVYKQNCNNLKSLLLGSSLSLAPHAALKGQIAVIEQVRREATDSSQKQIPETLQNEVKSVFPPGLCFV